MILELFLSLFPIILIVVLFKFFIDLIHSKKRNMPKFMNRNKERVRKEGKEPLKKLHFDDDEDDDDPFANWEGLNDFDDDDYEEFGFDDDDDEIEPMEE